MKILFVILLLLLIAAITYGVYIYLKRQQYTRERFAFAALASITSMSMLVLTSMKSNLMPWHIGLQLFNYVTSSEIKVREADWTDYSLLVLVYIVAVQAILSIFKSWDGLKSYEQYQREQRNMPTGIINEGVSELRRISKGLPPPVQFSEIKTRNVMELEPITDSLAWKDQARELIRLSSTSYMFSPSGWHDSVGYWIGKNVDGHSPVFLYPVHESVTEKEIKEFVEYTVKQGDYDETNVEHIIAILGGNTDKLVKHKGYTVRIVGEEALLSNLVDFTDYKNHINNRVLKDNLPDSDFKLNDVYVPAQITVTNIKAKEDVVPVNVEDYLKEWLGITNGKQIALLGEYGQGKSTATLMFTYRLLKESNPTRIPLLIELRGTSPRNLTPLQLIGAWAAQYNLNPQALMKLHIAGKLLLIFEGFDEMALIGDSEMRLKHFRTIWGFCYPKAKIVITGRPNFFLDEEEMKNALGIGKALANKPYCEAVRLLPFTLNEIEKSLRQHKGHVRDQICNLVKQNMRFNELVSRPSLLHIVSTLWESEGLFEKVEQLNSAFVMDLFIRHSYRRQGLKEADTNQFMALNTSEREFFMSAIASYMAVHNLPNQILSDQLNQLIEELVFIIPDCISTSATTITGEVRIPLKQRIKDAEYGIEHVKTDVRACGILVDDPSTPGAFKFGHKSFMEYLFASVVADKIINRESEKANAIFKVTAAILEDVITLPVSVEFLGEILGDKFSVGNNKDIIAGKLLRAFLSDNRMVRFLQRALLFEEAYRYAVKQKFSWFTSRLLDGLSPSKFTFFVSWLILATAMSPKSLKGVILTALVNAAIIIAYVFLKSPSFTTMQARMVLWLRLCTALNITCDVKHKVLLTWYVPWVKRTSLIINESKIVGLGLSVETGT
ncbi:hypothetical protein KP004_18820 [Geomonas oryzisoli]|uniref:NACHT domain-containing protein n=1 Tax=Geomonas oryzisoli TaxID=2847992 RepID=A0ABX8J6H9_9BACT|nr:hypothetical protein [Geomonas oryzisoli]QWV93194.1 hypothetical protein KP004_18820 [Geomonas oryzisoli]